MLYFVVGRPELQETLVGGRKGGGRSFRGDHQSPQQRGEASTVPRGFQVGLGGL